MLEIKAVLINDLKHQCYTLSNLSESMMHEQV